MKAEDLLKEISQDNGEYAGIKREDIDYSSRREENTDKYLSEVGEVSKFINSGLDEIKAKNVRK
jgi:hypothetical protein